MSKIFNIFKTKKEKKVAGKDVNNTDVPKITKESVPRHVAIIMDGNGRWAIRKNLHRTFGHAAGAQAFRNIVDYCIEIGIEYLTIYAFSTENWKRPVEEINSILKLFDEYLDDCLQKLAKYNVKIKFIGDRSLFPQKLVEKMNSIEAQTEKKRMILNIGINYGSRAEIVNAVNTIIEQRANLKTNEKITEDIFNSYLYTNDSPYPDLIIRTAGDQRLSNFLLWQAAYAELYFTDTLWPDFDKKALDAAVAEYAGRKRRYGGL